MTSSWDESYTADTPAPWDIGRPQQAFARLAERGLLAGNVLDVGCGSGEHAMLAASHGSDATGVDISAAAIAKARAKAAERGSPARFEVADALDLGAALRRTFDTAVDSGLFHTFDDASRPRYVASLASVLRPGGTSYLMCFSEHQPGEWGPRRVRQAELRAAFGQGWQIESIAADTFEINQFMASSETVVQAWLATITRL